MSNNPQGASDAPGEGAKKSPVGKQTQPATPGKTATGPVPREKVKLPRPAQKTMLQPSEQVADQTRIIRKDRPSEPTKPVMQQATVANSALPKEHSRRPSMSKPSRSEE